MPDPPATPCASPADDEPQTDRDEIQSLLADRIRALDAAIDAHDPDGLDEKKLQVRRNQVVGYLVNQYRKLLKDTDLDEMEDELAFLQEAVDVREDDR